MNRNFFIRDAAFFEFSGEVLDVCQLLSVEFRPGSSPSAEMAWGIQGSNRQLRILFSQVEDIIVTGRDEEYPARSGSTLVIAGFSHGKPDPVQPELYLEPTHEMNYMTFVMADRAAYAIKAAAATMRML